MVYLRALLYPDGFSISMGSFPADLFQVELVREACTLVMLVCVGMLAAENGVSRLAAVMVAFGAWDIFYYVGLYVFLDWPPSLMTWDLLFLIPVPWVSPVLAPILISVALVGCGTWFLFQDEKGRVPEVSGVDWALAVSGGMIVLVALMWRGSQVLGGAEPTGFPWFLFVLGEGMGLAAFFRLKSRAAMLKLNSSNERALSTGPARERHGHSL